MSALDVVFLIYVYQRWIYPVDPKRMNEFGTSGEDPTPSLPELQEEKDTNGASNLAITEHGSEVSPNLPLQESLAEKETDGGSSQAETESEGEESPNSLHTESQEERETDIASSQAEVEHESEVSPNSPTPESQEMETDPVSHRTETELENELSLGNGDSNTDISSPDSVGNGGVSDKSHLDKKND